jgi:hypothetical protein
VERATRTLVASLFINPRRACTATVLSACVSCLQLVWRATLSSAISARVWRQARIKPCCRIFAAQSNCRTSQYTLRPSMCSSFRIFTSQHSFDFKYYVIRHIAVKQDDRPSHSSRSWVWLRKTILRGGLGAIGTDGFRCMRT